MKVITPDAETIVLGVTETTPTIGITDYSRRVTDDFGTTTVVPRGFARRMSVRFALPSDEVDGVQRQLAALRAAPAQWIADDRFAWLTVTGFYKDFQLDLQTGSLSFCTLTVEGLAETEPGSDPGGDPAASGASTLLMLDPVEVSEAMLTASNVAETDYPQWSGATTYAEGARVISTATHRIYESAVAGNVGNDPTGASGLWIDVGPTNRWAMLDQALGTVTTRASGLSVTIEVGAVDAVALLDVAGSTVRVQTTGYDRTQPVNAGAISFLDLPGTDAPITITVNTVGIAGVGTLLAGSAKALGVTETSPTAGINDFSRKEVDDFGEVTVVPRGWAKRMSARALIRTDAVDMVANRIAAVRARPALWIGDDGTDCLTVYGFFKDFEIEVAETVGTLSLSIEGLSEASPPGPGLPPAKWPDIVDSDPASHPKPEDGATVGAPSGTPVGDRTADDVTQQIDTANQKADELIETFGSTASAAASASAAQGYAETAGTAADNANAAKIAASGARDAAETAQGAAETAANLASDKADAAAGSATAAAGSADSASGFADDAGTSATSASGSANTASVKAADAGDSADAAAGSASAALASQSAAGSSASAANTAKVAAEAARDDAAGSAAASSSSANSAAASESDAESAAAAAASSESTATTAAGTATAKADEAATSASNAQGYMNTASAQAIVAASSASGAFDTARMELPSTFEDDGKYFYMGGHQTKKPAATNLGNYPEISFADVAGVGRVIRYVGNGQDKYSRDVRTIGYFTPVAGRTYRLTARMRRTVNSTLDAAAPHISFRKANDSSNMDQGIANFWSSNPLGEWGDLTLTVTGDDLLAGGFTRAHGYLRFSYTAGTTHNATFECSMLKIADVTSEVASAGSASAAAGSASTATTKATEAGNSANAATAAKVAAEAAQGDAEGSADAASASASAASASAASADADAGTASTQAGLASGYKSDAEAAASAASGSATSADADAASAATNAGLTATYRDQAAGHASNAGGAAGAADASADIAEAQQVIATAAASAAQASSILSANVASQGYFGNAVFSDWPGGSSTLPTGYTYWSGSSFSVSKVSGGRYGSPNFLRMPTDAGNANYGIMAVKAIAAWGQPFFSGQWVVIEVDARLAAGTLKGAGVYFRTGSASQQTALLDLYADPDTAGQTGNGTSYNVRSWRKLVQLSGTSSNSNTELRQYIMNNWTAMPSYDAANDARTIDWYYVNVRPADDGEIKTGEIDGLVAEQTTQAAVLATHETRLASWLTRTSAGAGYAEISMSALDSNGASASRIGLTADWLSFGTANQRVMELVSGKVLVNGDLNVNNGKIVVDTGTYMKVIGKGFGTANQFIEWFGPKMALNLCSEANATSYVKMNGDAYFGGSLSVSTLKNQGGTSGASTSEVATVGPFGTNGNPIVVAVSWTYQKVETKSYGSDIAGRNAFDADAAAYNASDTGANNWSGSTGLTVANSTVTLARKIGAGSFSNVQSGSSTSGTGSFSGTRPVLGVSGGFATLTRSYGIAFTYTDNAGGTGDRTFTATLARGFTDTVGATTQRVSIVTTEE